VNGRTIATLLGAPLCAAIAYLLFAFAVYPSTPPEYAIQPGLIFGVGLAFAAIFEVLVLAPLWYVLRGATVGSRVALWVFGFGVWFVLTTGMGYLLGHGLATAVSFATPFLVPGFVVSLMFAALVQPRTNA
jgi:hypothetical protein